MADFHIISRTEAMEQGLNRYFTGVPCRKEHLCERYVVTGVCVICRADWDQKGGIARAAGRRRTAPRGAPVELSRPSTRLRDWSNLTPEQIDQWHARVRNIKPNGKMYRHEPLNEHPVRMKLP